MGEMWGLIKLRGYDFTCQPGYWYYIMRWFYHLNNTILTNEILFLELTST